MNEWVFAAQAAVVHSVTFAKSSRRAKRFPDGEIFGRGATVPITWMFRIKRDGKTLEYGEDEAGTYLAIFVGDGDEDRFPIAKFQTSFAELTGLLELSKAR